MRRRSEGRDAAIVVGAAIVLRALFLAETSSDPLFHTLAIDARSYRDLAARIAAGDVLLAHEPLWFAPLYPVLLALVFVLVGVDPRTVVIGQLLLGAASAYLGFRIGRRVSPLAGRVAGLVLGLSPVPLVYESQLLYTALAVFLTTVFLTTFLRAARTEGRGVAAGAGVALGALSLVSGSALLFAPVGAWQLLRGRRLARGAAFVTGVAVALLPVLLRNGLAAGTWTPLTSNAGMLFATGFAPESRGGRSLLRTPNDFGPDGAYLREAERATGRTLSLAEASRWHRDRTWERIERDPTWALGLIAQKAALLLNAREIDDNLGPSTFAPRSRVLRWVAAPWGLALLGAVVGVALAGRRRDGTGDDVRLLTTFAVVYALSLLPFFVTARYRLPLTVPMAVLCGVAVDGVRNAWRGHEWRRLVLPGVLAVTLSPFVFRDPGVREDPAVALNAAGSALLNDGHAAEALPLLDRALAADPSLAGAHANRALALAALGRPGDALSAAKEAVRLDASLADAWLTEGALLARSGRVAEALPAFRRAAELRPSDPRALENLARALAATGSRDEAVDVGERAIAAGARDLAAEVEAWAKPAPVTRAGEAKSPPE